MADRFVAGRGFLRTVLGAYLRLDPGLLTFEYGPHGKPRLGGVGRDLRFNLSHSEGQAVLGVVEGRTIGLDIEFERPGRDLDAIARRFFAPREVEVYESLSSEERPTAFYRCWTRKEAYLKAQGGGLSERLDRFVVSLEPDAPPALLWSELDPEDHPGWTMVEFAPEAGFAGAVLTEGAAMETRGFDLPG